MTALLLAACGGGKGSSSSGSSGSGGSSTVTSVTLTGVAATSAPFLGASIKVVDATGKLLAMQDAAGNAITSASTNTADGSYRLTVTGSAITLPLLIQASGRDVTGTQVVLHSLLQTNTAPTIANISPASNAVVAELLGANPKTIFAAASSNTASLALLGNATAVTNAIGHIKTVIAANLSDAKVTKPDFFQDSSFSTNKAGLDAALESLNFRIDTDSSGKDQLQISNKFAPPGPADVAIDLATAKTELSKASGTTMANAVVSSTKATAVTTPTATLGVLDNLTTNLNKLIAQNSAASAFSAFISGTPVPPSPTATGTIPYVYNGRDANGLTAKLAGYASTNYQLSKLQITGCADISFASPLKPCTYYGVAGTVSDSTGKPLDVFRDTVIYNKTANAWTFAGNGRSSEILVYPLAYTQLALDGSGATTPSVGVEVALTGQDGSGGKVLDSAIVQLPSGYSVPFVYCNSLFLCASTSPATPATVSGELKDLLLQQPALGWIGSKDGLVGAKYAITTTSGSTSQNLTLYMPASVPSTISTSQLPQLDGVGATAALSPANILAGTTLAWNTWAAANPDSRIFMLRFIVSSASADPVITDFSLPFGNVNTVTTNAITLPDGYAVSAYELLVGAQDSLGRRYFSAYKGTP
jgi:hypothetical protein